MLAGISFLRFVSRFPIRTRKYKQEDTTPLCHFGLPRARKVFPSPPECTGGFAGWECSKLGFAEPVRGGPFA